MEDAAPDTSTMPPNQADVNETLFEWMMLGRSLQVWCYFNSIRNAKLMIDPSQKANQRTRSRFCLCLQMLGLSLLEDYDSSEASEVLARDEASLLAPFLQVERDLKPESFDYDQAHHIIALARGLFEELGGERDPFQHRYDPQYSILENQMICGAIIEVEGACSMENIDSVQMHKAISRSSLIGDEKLDPAEVLELINTCRKVVEDWVYV